MTPQRRASTRKTTASKAKTVNAAPRTPSRKTTAAMRDQRRKRTRQRVGELVPPPFKLWLTLFEPKDDDPSNPYAGSVKVPVEEIEHLTEWLQTAEVDEYDNVVLQACVWDRISKNGQTAYLGGHVQPFPEDRDQEPEDEEQPALEPVPEDSEEGEEY